MHPCIVRQESEVSRTGMGRDADALQDDQHRQPEQDDGGVAAGIEQRLEPVDGQFREFAADPVFMVTERLPA